MEIIQYLNSKGLKYKQVTRPKGPVAIMNCPFCGDKENKFAVSLADGAFNCFRMNNCGVKGSFWDLQKAFGDDPKPLNGDSKIYHNPQKNYKAPETKGEALKNDGLDWLFKRGFTRETIEKFRIGQKNGSLMIPSFKNGTLINIKFRSLKEKKFWNEKDAQPILFNQDNCHGSALAITEGHFDTMALDQYGIPAVSVPNGVKDLEWIELDYDWLEKFERIYLFFDNDVAGQDAIKEIVNRLGRWRCYSVVLPFKDANECLINGVAKDEITNAIENAGEFDPAELKSARDLEDVIIDEFENPAKSWGISTPYEKLTEILRGWRGGEVTVWTGSSGSGKTTMLNDVIIKNIRNGHKTIVASLEMPIRKLLKWLFMRIEEQTTLTDDQVREVLEEIGDYLFVIDVNSNIDYNLIVELLDYAARKYGVKNFIIDSLLKVNFPGKDIFQEHTDFMNRLISDLAFAHNGHVHLVAHPRKTNRDDYAPGKVDVAGTGNITNLAHNVIVVWRPDEEKKQAQAAKGVLMPDAVLYVRKHREWGTMGKVEFDFDANSKKFIEQV